MGQPLTVPPPGFDDLPVEEKIDNVQALWKRIASKPYAGRRLRRAAVIVDCE
jgi:hypothetical protein